MKSFNDYLEYQGVNIESLATKIINTMDSNPEFFKDDYVSVTLNNMSIEELYMLKEYIETIRPDISLVLMK